MKILLIGGGGREHALAWRVAESPLVDVLYAAPGNPGIARHARCLPIPVEDHEAIVSFAQRERIDLTIIGPEVPLVAGLWDALAARGLLALGPSARAAAIEGSKTFAKDLMARHGIPTAAYATFSDPAAARAYGRQLGAPLVVKADGLAAGKGAFVCPTLADADEAIALCMERRGFGAAGATVVVEEFLRGEEISFFAVANGTDVVPLAAAQDHKTAFDDDRGPNTGGMGAYSPAPVMTPEMIRRTMDEIIRPTVAGMAHRGTPFKGVLFLGVMITESGPKLYEYNVRFGDPECQVLMMRLKSDLLAALVATADGVLRTFDLRWHEDAALTVVMAAKGYPGDYEKNTPIAGLDRARAMEGVEVFHAGTRRDGDRLLAVGGRVLSVTARGKTVSEAQRRAYEAVRSIDWPGGFYRTDIGWRAIARERGRP
jgi:phosphoribosylamine--glycine ligase